MKTKTLLLLCLFIGIGFTTISAQNGQSDKTYSEWYTATWSDPVFCDGVLADWLDCSITVHHIAKFVQGQWLHCFVQCTGTAVSEKNNEEFTIKEVDKQDNNIQANGDWLWVADSHFNAKGSNGTQYIIFCTLYWDGRVDCVRSNCH